MEDYLLVIDNGGTNTKAVVFDLQGIQIGVASFPTPKIELSGERREVSMDVMWESVSQAVCKLLKENNIQGKQIIGITTVGHGKGLYVLNNEGKTICNGILSADNRGQGIVQQLSSVVEEIQSLSVQSILACQAPILLRWLKENEPETYHQIGSIMSAKDYVRFCLTDAVYAEYTDMSGNNLLNLSTRSYDHRLVELFGIEEMWNKLPKLKNCYENCGYVTKKASIETGLCEGTPVFAGMFDIDACAIATQVLDDSYISMVAGTWSINTFPSMKLAPVKQNIMNSLFVDEKQYLIESSSATSAGNLESIFQVLLKESLKDMQTDDMNIYDICEKYLRETTASTTEILFLPFLYGTNIQSTVKASFINFGSGASVMEYIRSVYEGIVFSHKYHLNELLKVKETPTKGIRLSGGVINSEEWIQIFANILNFPIEMVEAKELGALGGAITLAVGLGLYENIHAATQHLTHIKKTIYPCEKEVSVYHEKFKKYMAITEAMEKIYAN